MSLYREIKGERRGRSPKYIKIPGIRRMASKEKKGDAPPARDERAPRSQRAPAPPSHPPELPRSIAGGEIRINVGEGEIQPAEDPITDSEITEEGPRLNIWPHPESFSSGSDSSPKCGSCSFITDFFSDYCCKIL